MASLLLCASKGARGGRRVRGRVRLRLPPLFQNGGCA